MDENCAQKRSRIILLQFFDKLNVLLLGFILRHSFVVVPCVPFILAFEVKPSRTFSEIVSLSSLFEKSIQLWKLLAHPLRSASLGCTYIQ